MKLKLTLIAASLSLSCAGLAHAQQAQPAQQQKEGIEQQHKAATEKCDNLQDNAKAICKAEADGQKTVAQAQAKVSERDTPKARLDMEKTKAEAQYNIAKARCGDQVGDAKKACEKEAKATQDLAIAQAERRSLTQSSGGGSSGTSASGSGTSPAQPAAAPSTPSAAAPAQTPPPAAQPPAQGQPSQTTQ